MFQAQTIFFATGQSQMTDHLDSVHPGLTLHPAAVRLLIAQLTHTHPDATPVGQPLFLGLVSTPLAKPAPGPPCWLDGDPAQPAITNGSATCHRLAEYPIELGHPSIWLPHLYLYLMASRRLAGHPSGWGYHRPVGCSSGWGYSGISPHHSTNCPGMDPVPQCGSVACCGLAEYPSVLGYQGDH